MYFLDCTLKFSVRYQLVDHLKSHTKEKSCACPICGVMFSTYTKFKDHCRQSNKGKYQFYNLVQFQKMFIFR